jgi:hypothetical protein
MPVWEIIKYINRTSGVQASTSAVKQTGSTNKKTKKQGGWNGSKNVGQKGKNKAWDRSQSQQNKMANYLDRRGVSPQKVTLASVFADQLAGRIK